MMKNTIKKSLIILLFLSMLLTACKSSVPEQMTTEARATEDQTAEKNTKPQDTAGETTDAEAPATTVEEGTTAGTTAEQEDQTSPQPGGDALVVFFSRMGNTDFPSDVDVVSSASLGWDDGEMKGNAEILAQYVAEATGAPVYEILTVEKYPASYNDTTDKALEEQREDHRPELANHLEAPDSIKELWLVTPNWWGDLPMPVYTFLEEYDFSGVTINLLVTHGGSGFSNIPDTIQKLEPEAVIGKTLKIYHDNVGSAYDQIAAWVRE